MIKNIPTKAKEWVEQQLSKLDFVTWDRLVVTNLFGDIDFTVYGWIDRDKDNYKDFVVLEFNVPEHTAPPTVNFISTSSDKYSQKIGELLGTGHTRCSRVEDYFNIENMISLGDT